MLKKLLLPSLLLVALLTGCSAGTSGDVQEEKGQTGVQTEASKEQGTDSSGKEMVDIDTLAAEGSFNVNWHTKDGEYASGTAFLMDSNVHGEKLLVTAFHFLWPEDADTFTGKELPEYVLGGEIFYALDYSATGASLKNCVIIEDADSSPNIEKDVAAFTIQGGDDLRTLPLATKAPKKGEKIYLLASLWDTEDIHENCVYEGKVSSVDGGVLLYSLEGKPGTGGASGGPIVNEAGEVVAIHMGSNPFGYVAHTTESFLAQINAGTVSEITYPEITKADTTQEPTEDTTEEGSEAYDYEYVEYTREEKVSTLYYDVQIDGVTVSDTLNGASCQDGFQYVVLDVSLWAAKDMTEPVNMFYFDFSLEWEDAYCDPLEGGLTDTQLPDEYTITQDVTTGQLVFMAPKGEEKVYFSFLDAYFEDATSQEPSFITYYGIEIPLENWTR